MATNIPMKPPSEFDFSQPVGSNGFYRYRIASELHPMKGNQQVNTFLYIMREEADEIMKSFTFKKVYMKYSHITSHEQEALATSYGPATANAEIQANWRNICK